MSSQIVKFIHTADWHMGMENYSRVDPETGLSSRLKDFGQTIDFIVDYAIQEKVDFLLFAGDAYKNREPTPTHQREFSQRILKLSRAGIPCILLVGNHDTSNTYGKASSIDIYSTLEVENVQVIRKPEIIKLKGVQIIGLPWLAKRDFENQKAALVALYKQVEKDKPLIVCTHASVEGAVFGSERTVSLGGDYVVKKADLTVHPQTVYVALGHIHKRQVLSNTVPIVYSGSIERVDFGEEKEEKTFELVEVSGRTKHTPIPTPARKFLTIKVEISSTDLNPTKTILQEISKHNFADYVVKVVVNFAPESNTDIKVEEVKKALSEAFMVAGINKNIERQVRNKLGEGVQAERLEPAELLEKYFQTKGYSENKIKTLMEYARKFMEG